MNLIADLTKPHLLMSSQPTVLDPLDHDREDDARVVTTRRAICRVAFAAAETASRFQREGLDVDPMDWMMSPRQLFNGSSAFDACLSRGSFTRAILLHGLSLGLDAEPDAIDDLCDEDLDDEEAEFDDYETSLILSRVEAHLPRLFSATIDVDRGGTLRHGFHASMASSIHEFRERLAVIFGADSLRHAVCHEGLNVSVPLVAELVAPELLQTLQSAHRGHRGRGVSVTAERLVELDA